jgi:hypothetical protein
MPGGPVPIAALRRLRRRLEALALAHPELVGPSSPESEAGWLAVLEENERMSPVTKTTGFRLSDELLARIDAHARDLSALAGVPISRAAVVVKLLTERLDQIDAEAKKARRTRRPPGGRTIPD